MRILGISGSPHEAGSTSFALRCALQACQQYDRRWLMTQIELGDTLTQGCSQLVVQDLDECLSGRETAQHFSTDGAFTYAGHEVADHRQRDICLDKRTAHIAHRVFAILFRQPAAAAHLVENTA